MTEKTKKKILVVEDSNDFRFILETSFSKAGFDVYCAADGLEGLNSAREKKPDLIFLDILMPNIDGIEMARILKGENIKTPIIFLTNLSDVDHIAKAEETVMSDYIIKSNTPVEKIIEMAKNKLNIK